MYLGVGLLQESDSFKSHTTGAHHKIRGHITCTTSNIIYLISCRICGIQYIGEMKNSLKKCFYGHRSTVKTQKLDTPVGQHFNLPNHSISDMILQGIEALANCREARRLLTVGNRSVSAEKRCGSSMSTPFTPMVSTFRKGMTNFPLFFPPFFFPHRNYLHLFYIYFYICSTFVLFVSLFVSFVLHPLSDSLLFIITSSSINGQISNSLAIPHCNSNACNSTHVYK